MHLALLYRHGAESRIKDNMVWINISSTVTRNTLVVQHYAHTLNALSKFTLKLDLSPGKFHVCRET